MLLLNTNFLIKLDKKQKQKVHAWLVVCATFEAEKLKYSQFHGNCFSSNTENFLVRERFWNTCLVSINIEIFPIFFEQTWSKIQNYLFKLKYTKLKYAKFDVEAYFYWVNLVQNINCLSRILVLRLSLMYSIQW